MGGVLSLPSMGRRVRRRRPAVSPVPLAISHPRPLRPRARPLSTAGASVVPGSPRRISTSSYRLSRSSWRSMRPRPRSVYTLRPGPNDDVANQPQPKRHKGRHGETSRRATTMVSEDPSDVPSSSATCCSDHDRDHDHDYGQDDASFKHASRPRSRHSVVAGTKRSSHPDAADCRKLRKLDMDDVGVWFADAPSVLTADIFAHAQATR